jgi:hypothetical protein
MATAAQTVRAILQSLVVAGSEQEIPASEAQDTIFAMNNYMLALAADGVNLGYTEVNNLSDLITIPSGALRGLISNVAIDMAPEFGAIVSPALQKRASESLKTMYTLGITKTPTRMPSTLPIGSGNSDTTNNSSYNFYPEAEAQILAEASGAIGLEALTEET